MGLSKQVLDALANVHDAASSDDLDATFAVVVHAMTAAVPACRWASVTVVTDGGPGTAANDGANALEVDLAQYKENKGPCVHAARHGELVIVDDAGRDNRWPLFSAAAAEIGVRSALSVPIVTESSPAGAINLYGDAVAAFDQESIAIATEVARHTVIAIGKAKALSDAQSVAHHLQLALESRDVIGQAKGILMMARKITDAEAFDLLRGASQRRNVKLRDVAEEVTRTGLLDG